MFQQVSVPWPNFEVIVCRCMLTAQGRVLPWQIISVLNALKVKINKNWDKTKRRKFLVQGLIKMEMEQWQHSSLTQNGLNLKLIKSFIFVIIFTCHYLVDTMSVRSSFGSGWQTKLLKLYSYYYYFANTSGRSKTVRWRCHADLLSTTQLGLPTAVLPHRHSMPFSARRFVLMFLSRRKC